uniref:hypothetical protein n=1 Tax=Amycolatopsis sp. CA-096443 TaxID=3239919 RepID=UPI003F49191C
MVRTANSPRDVMHDVSCDVPALVVPGLDSYASELVGQAIADVAPSAPDDAEALDDLRTAAGRLLADVFVAGQLNAAVHPDAWPLTPLVKTVLSALSEARGLDALDDEAENLE